MKTFSFGKPNRRQFLTTLGITGLAGAGWLGYRARQTKIPVGLIGCGKRGRQLAKTIMNSPTTNCWGELKAICDVNELALKDVHQQICPAAQTYSDYQELLARKDIEAVFIVTPDHWHVPMTLEAINCGKAVYCEKPMSLTIGEGQNLVDKVQSQNAIVQVGTQQRSHWRFQQAIEQIRNGEIGKLQKITIDLPENMSGGPFKITPSPQNLNWDQWLGPAPLVDYIPERTNFRGWYEYSGGKITDWGAHHVDIAHLAIGDNTLAPSKISGTATLPVLENAYNVPTEYRVSMSYPDNIEVILQSNSKNNWIQFEGEAGSICVNRSYTSFKSNSSAKKSATDIQWQFPDKITTLASSLLSYEALHLLNFFQAIEHGIPLRSDVKSHQQTITACHLANIALRSGQEINWNSPQMNFEESSQQLSSYYSRPSRLNHKTQLAENHNQQFN